MTNEQSQNGSRGYQIDENGRRAEGRYSKSVNMCRAIVKMVIKYLRTKWMAPDKCGGTFPEHCSGQVQ